MPDGRLRADAYITRAGVFEYMDADGRRRRELRPADEVFHPESMSSFAQVPVTNDHPEVGLLDSKTAKDYMVGSTGENVSRSDDHVRTSVMVADANTINQMESGKVAVSCGYSCDVDETPGYDPVHGRYDAIQRNIRGNHVAIVDSARAGKMARIRLDGAAIRVRSDDEKFSFDAAPRRGEHAMDPEKLQETIRSLGAQLTAEKERADKAENELKVQQTRADVAEGKLMTVETRVDELQTQIASQASAVQTDALVRERKRADDAESKVARFDATIEKRVRVRASLERQAMTVMGDDFRMNDLNDRQIMAAVVKRLDSGADVSASVADGIIQGRFLSLLEGFSKNARSQANVAALLADDREQQPRVDSKEQKKRQLRDQWKQPLPNDIRAKSAGKES